MLRWTGPVPTAIPSWKRRNWPTYNPRRNRDRNDVPASADTRTQKLRPPISQSCSTPSRQCRNHQVVNNSPRAVGNRLGGSGSPAIRRQAVSQQGSDFGRELLACAVDGTDADEQPAAARVGPRSTTGQRATVAAVGRPGRGARLRRSRCHRAVVTSGRGRRARAFGSPRRAQYRYRVGQVAGLSATHSVRAVRRSARQGALPVSDQGARTRPTAHGAGVGELRRAFGRRGTEPVRRGQQRRRETVCAGTVAVDLLQPGHDPPVAVAQPRPVGGVPAQPKIHRGRRMSLLPRHFRIERGNGASQAGAAVRALCRRRLRRARR